MKDELKALLQKFWKAFGLRAANTNGDSALAALKQAEAAMDKALKDFYRKTGND